MPVTGESDNNLAAMGLVVMGLMSGLATMNRRKNQDYDFQTLSLINSKNKMSLECYYLGEIFLIFADKTQESSEGS